ncbi:hypothetical protein X011_00370 [Mycobacterium tuberculosis variant microti OV254]|nr:hypothetical protein X011_00370 [Mycobacterium tuberculosis variant microti OV254]
MAPLPVGIADRVVTVMVFADPADPSGGSLVGSDGQ